MALKTTNYEVKELGITLPEACAIIKDININGEYGCAKFVVQQSRGLALEKGALEEVDVFFKVNRNENPYVTAYNEAKKCKEVEVEADNGKVLKTKVKGYFYGWDNDILAE